MAKRVLLSIKPEFVEKIFNGEKKFEYRKVLFKNNKINKVVIYASSPVKKVVGEFKIGDILYTTKKELWESTQDKSGITKEFFDEYFSKKELAYAIEIKETEQYKEPKSLKEDFNISNAPQSFRYI
ncbi:MAG: ASCH domain-containing protein [Balneola sp.]